MSQWIAVWLFKALRREMRDLRASLLHSVNYHARKIMTQAQDTADAITAIGTQIDKIGTETKASLDKITELEAAIANQPTGTVDQSILDAVASVKAKVQSVDDMVADVSVPVDPGTGTDPVDPAPVATAKHHKKS